MAQDERGLGRFFKQFSLSAKQAIRDKLIEHKQYIARYGEDMPEVRDWQWGGRSGRNSRPLTATESVTAES